ncbi:MAG: hypothetical protein WCF04_14515 [Candidatus Nanopelagicales bacterium]
MRDWAATQCTKTVCPSAKQRRAAACPRPHGTPVARQLGEKQPTVAVTTDRGWDENPVAQFEDSSKVPLGKVISAIV